MGEAEDSQAEAYDLSSRAQKDCGGSESPVGKGEESGVKATKNQTKGGDAGPPCSPSTYLFGSAHLCTSNFCHRYSRS